MIAGRRFNYYRRLFAAYLTPQKSQLTFWHEVPEVNERVSPGVLGEYYMSFREKADYPGQYDAGGIPLLNYHGTVGLQYNPIAISQYGLANYNLYRLTGNPERYRRFLGVADWLLNHLERNSWGLWVWNHHFDWEYRNPLKAPWYSALAQGQGMSVLLRAYRETSREEYLDGSRHAFQTFVVTVDRGGVRYVDGKGFSWFEETIVDPPTHILNGFIWAAWGVYDFSLATGEKEAETWFAEAVRTLEHHLPHFDAGFWSLYEQSGTRLRMLASPFYHRLHTVQLRVMHELTGEAIFADYAERWKAYQRSRINRSRALSHKALFKLLYY